MIGLFGQWVRDRSAPVDLGAMAGRHPARLAVRLAGGRGGALGLAMHPGSRCVSHASAGAVEVLVSGEIFAPMQIRPEATTAADLVLALYRESSLDQLARANGQFGAAVFDSDHHSLTLITDRLATLPLHHWSDDRGFVFATQLYTLLGEERIPRRANREAIAQLFTLQRTISTTTPIQDVEAVPAGTICTISASGVKTRTYWNLRWTSPPFGKQEGARALAGAFRAALGRQSDGGDVGLLLSGGLDSRLTLAAADRKPVCWTTASFEGNPELELARTVAGIAGAQHHTVLVEPAHTLAVQDETTKEGGGMFPASTSVSAFMPAVAKGSRISLTGHGLDYTLRGYYLPSRFLQLAGSNTRLPMLAQIPARPTAADLFARLRQGPPRQVVERIVSPRFRDEWFHGQVDRLGKWLALWLQSSEPVNAWDAFILAQVSKHYAFTSMASVRSFTDLRIPAFDNDILEIYLAMPPQWRVEATMTQAAMQILSPELARLPNANTGFRADLNSWLEIGALLGRAALRRAGLAARPKVPSQSHSAGSWQNMTVLFREDPAHVKRFRDIADRMDFLSFGILDADAVRSCIFAHLNGEAKHTKLLRQLLAHDSWARVFDVSQ